MAVFCFALPTLDLGHLTLSVTWLGWSINFKNLTTSLIPGIVSGLLHDVEF